MFEPIIKTDLSALPKTIETNIDELAPVINERIEFARSIVINPDSADDLAKCDADAALLAKMSKKISRFRIDWTAEWDKPFLAVIEKCKDYERRLNEAAAELREKSAIGKAKVADAKKARLWSMYSGALKEAGFDLHPWFTQFFEAKCDPKATGNWLLKGKTDAEIRTEIDAELARCKGAQDTISACYAGDAAALAIAQAELVKAFDTAAAVAVVNAYHERAELAARMTAKAAPAPAPAPAPVPAPAPAPAKGEKVETYRLEITGTRANLWELRKWGEAHGISFKKI